MENTKYYRLKFDLYFILYLIIFPKFRGTPTRALWHTVWETLPYRVLCFDLPPRETYRLHLCGADGYLGDPREALRVRSLDATIRTPVSYTHLDVYKRQRVTSVT